jgi:hypothetical protein
MINRVVAVLAFFGLLMIVTAAASCIVQPAKAQATPTGPGSAGQSGVNVGGIDRHLFCNTGVTTPICK